MYHLCITLMVIGVTLFLATLCIAILDDTDNPYTGIVYNKTLGTSICWERLAQVHFRSALEYHYALQRSRNALDVYIENITRPAPPGAPMVVLKVKDPMRIAHLEEWNKLCAPFANYATTRTGK